jgi:hypothetical protein
LQAGMGMYRGNWIAKRQPDAGTVLFGNLKVNATGYPCGPSTGTACDAAPFAPVNGGDCAGIYTGLMESSSPSVAANADTAVATAVTLKTVKDANPDIDFVASYITGGCTYYHLTPNTSVGTTAFGLLYTAETGMLSKAVEIAM